jgi:hypothetical protein
LDIRALASGGERDVRARREGGRDSRVIRSAGRKRRPWRGFIGSRWARADASHPVASVCFLNHARRPPRSAYERGFCLFLSILRKGVVVHSMCPKRILLRGFSMFRVGEKICDELNFFNAKISENVSLSQVSTINRMMIVYLTMIGVSFGSF